MSAYADTSFLVSLYTPDANSASAIRQIQQHGARILFSTFGELELMNALQLRVFRREITAAEAKAAQAAFVKDVGASIVELRDLTLAILELARQISSRRTAQLGTRSGDILHVASALQFKAERFLTFDKQQKKLARAEGLNIR